MPYVATMHAVFLMIIAHASKMLYWFYIHVIPDYHKYTQLKTETIVGISRDTKISKSLI